MSSIGRRTFFASAAGLVLVRPDSRATPARVTLAQHRPTYVRRNVYCLNATSPEIRAYTRAVQVMRSRPATDPTSWQAQSNIHGAFRPNAAAGIVNRCPPATSADFVAPPGMIADACRHDRFFLAWHRVYLHYFERIVRAASGDPGFALPYWGYSPAGPRSLPAVFRGAATNPLWTPQRVPAVNSGTNLSASAVDAGPALANAGYNAFQSQLSGTPHGVVHTSVGGGCGWMSFFETAGMDPVFWLHHCNIDRLWDDWISSGGGRENPTGDASWMNQTFTFYDESGATVNLRVDQVLETATQLNYRYASPSACQAGPRCYCLPFRPWLADLRVVSQIDTIASRRALQQRTTGAQRQQRETLGATPREIRLPVETEGRSRFSAMVRDPQAGRGLRLVFDDIRLEQDPAVYYEVYANLPSGATPTYTSAHYIGNLEFFGSAKSQQRMSRELDLLAPYVRLQAQNRWPNDTLRITLVPRAPTEGGSPARILGNRAQATFGRVTIVFE